MCLKATYYVSSISLLLLKNTLEASLHRPVKTVKLLNRIHYAVSLLLT